MDIRLGRLGKSACRLGGPVASVLLGWTGAGSVLAQPPKMSQPAVQQQPATQRNYLNKNHIRLPIQITDAGRSSLQEVQLYIKEHPNAPWMLRDKVAPSQKAFTIHLPKDGEYAFTMVTVDKQGRKDCEDLRTEMPKLIVVIDTQAPQTELINLGQTAEGQVFQFDVRDANIDAARTQFAFQGGDRVYRPVEALPGRPNLFCIPVQAVFTGMIRATAGDLGGNVTVIEEHISKLANPRVVAASAQPSTVPVTAPTPTPTQVPQLVQQAPSNPTTPRPLTRTVVVAPPVLPQLMETKHVVARPDPECRLVEHAPVANPQFLPQLVSPGVTPSVSTPALVTTTSAPTPTALTTTSPATSPATKRQIVNNPKLFLDYQLENVGPSGVSKLQFWITRDQSRTWTKLSEITHQGSPVEVNLPGDGQFGVTLVACNGRGIPGMPPKAGDAPDWQIEVDTQKPAVEISKIAAVPENGQHVVHIHWTAQDRNFAATPVDLFYAATIQGPWLPIAKGLKAEGQHRWTPPVEIGAQAHVRLIARDAAGNMTIVNTLEPILIGDQARPRAIIRHVSTNAPAPVAVVPVK